MPINLCHCGSGIVRLYYNQQFIFYSAPSHDALHTSCSPHSLSPAKQDQKGGAVEKCLRNIILNTPSIHVPYIWRNVLLKHWIQGEAKVLESFNLN